MPGVFLISPGAVFFDPNTTDVESNATITANSSAIFGAFGAKQVTLVVNIKAAPTGTSPTLTFTIQEVDPGDQTTVIGASVSTAALNSITTAYISLPLTQGGYVKVSWTIGGTGTPTFTQVYATLSEKVGGPLVALDASGVEHALLCDTSGRSVVVGAGTAGGPAGGVVSVQGVASGTAVPISAASLPLPTGAATAANQTTIGNQTTEINDGTRTATIKAASTAAVAGDTSLVVGLSPNSPVPAGSNAIGSVSVTNFPATQPVSGTVTANQGTPNTNANGWPVEITDGTNVLGTSTHPIRNDPTGTTTQPISAAALPLPSGAATSANQTTIGSQTTELNDGTHTATIKAASTAAAAGDTSLVVGLSPNSPLPAGANALGSVTVTGTSTVSGTVTSNQGTPNSNANSWPVEVTDGTNVLGTSSHPLRIDPTGTTTQPISAASLPLPTGAATAANQTTVGSQTTEINDGTRTVVIKAASTAAAAADTSLVVALSPNSPVPAGTNAIGTVAQGTAAALSSKWPVQVTDGTNVMPTADVASRAQFDKITDGTNVAAVKAASTAAVATDTALVVAVSPNNTPVLPSGAATASNQTTLGQQTTEINDGTHTATIKAASTASVAADTSLVVGLSPNSPLPAGTNAIGTVAQGTAAALTGHWPVQVTDGTHTMPTMDAVARAGFVEITDGTNGPASVKAASTAPVAADLAQVVVISPNQASIPVTTAPSGSTPGLSPGYLTTTSKSNVPLQASTYNEQSANFTGSVVSASANDSSAGTGARTISIAWMNSTGTTTGTESATMNGTTAVNLVTTTKCFIEKLTVASVGSGGVNAGAITIFTGSAGAGTAVAIINTGDNQTYLGHHYVVSGKSCHVTDLTGVTNSSNQATFTLAAVSIPVANLPVLQVSDWVVGSQTFQLQRTYSTPIVVAGPARLQMYVVPGATASILSQGDFDYYDQ